MLLCIPTHPIKAFARSPRPILFVFSPLPQGRGSPLGKRSAAAFTWLRAARFLLGLFCKLGRNWGTGAFIGCFPPSWVPRAAEGALSNAAQRRPSRKAPPADGGGGRGTRCPPAPPLLGLGCWGMGSPMESALGRCLGPITMLATVSALFATQRAPQSAQPQLCTPLMGTGSSRASQPHVRDARQGSVPIPFSSPASSPPCPVQCQRKRAGGTGSDARPLREGQEAAQADFRKREATHDTRCPTSGISAWHLSTSPLPAVTPSSPPPGTEHPPLGSPNPCPARWHNHGYPGATPAPRGYVLGSTNSQALFKGFYFSKYTAYLQV